MPLAVVWMVLAAAFFHAAWNAVLKSQPDKFSGMFAQFAAMFVLCFAGALWHGAPPREVWVWLAAGQVVHLAYDLLLMATYRRGDMSATYPVLRGAAPPLSALGAFVFLGETPPLVAVGGIVLVSAGVMLFAHLRGGSKSALMFALMTAACIAVYSLIDAKGARLSGNPTQYAFWLLLLDSACFMALAMFGGRARQLSSLPLRFWIRGAVGGVFCVAAYGLVLVAYARAPVGMVAALRETSVIFGALLGMFFLGEQKSAVRLTGAAVIVCGAALIAVA